MYNIADDLLGFIAIILISIVTIFIANRWPEVASIIYAALIVRVIFLLIGHYVIPLPDSDGDASTFEGQALLMSQNGLSNLLTGFSGPGSSFISWIIAIVYSLTGRSILMAKSISLFFGVGVVFFGWFVAKEIWDKRSALKAGWILALFPSLILYSCLTMREVYASFFLLIALYGVISWIKYGSIKSFVLAMAGFICATFFHGGMFLGALVFLTIVGINNFKKTFIEPIASLQYLNVILISLIIIIFIGNYFLGKFEIPKLGSFEDLININRLYVHQANSTDGDAAYPTWLIISTPAELFYKGPIRVLYFLFSPYIWDITKMSHLIGVLDSFIYIYLTYLILLNKKIILSDRVLKIILIILIAYIVLFGISVGNFGTGIRHRSKFIIMIVLLVAPLLPKFVVKLKNKSNAKIF